MLDTGEAASCHQELAMVARSEVRDAQAAAQVLQLVRLVLINVKGTAEVTRGTAPFQQDLTQQENKKQLTG